MRINILFITFWLVFPDTILCQNTADKPVVPSVTLGKDGKLSYTRDSAGNRIPDFSYCGYRASEEEIPNVTVKVFVPVGEGDATEKIQRAIDYVSSLPADAKGFRGAIQLGKGVFRLKGRLIIRASGVVLRGSGMDENGTLLIAAGKDRQTFIRISGVEDIQREHPVAVKDAYVPVGSCKLHVRDPGRFKPGDPVILHRPSTQEWINLLGMNEFGGETAWLGWKPGQCDIFWNRTITAVSGDEVTIDAPITTSIDQNPGSGFLQKYDWPGQISRTGIENLVLHSEYDPSNAKDEQHCWSAVTVENARDCWVRHIEFRHFAGSAVAVYETAQRITVEDCISLQPVSEIGGWRRNTFFTMGQQTLFLRCYAENGYHDFAAGFCAAGPNAFVQCESFLPFSFSGAVDSWASGLLMDIVNVDGGNLSFKNREQDNHGAGWCAANSMFWQCTANRIDCYAPPGAYNQAYGAWAQFSGNGTWIDANNHIRPRSLFFAQLAERLGKPLSDFEDQIMPVPGNPTTSPTIAQAADLTVLARNPALLLPEFIRMKCRDYPANVSEGDLINIDDDSVQKPAVLNRPDPVILVNGWLTTEKGGVITGKCMDVPWWRGDARPYEARQARPAVTRFVPGRTGTGYTDDLSEVVRWMKTNHIVALDHNYGLWYDRRRDDHERVRRANGDAWAPFYELPFARSGVGTAWDGLSKYDLTHYNDWYWDRLKQFAGLADQNGMVLIHQHYFQHNILEAGAHWADFPWRSANNINNTGFPEPPPYAGDKRIFMDEHFYDISHPVRKEIHRSYIRKCLENFEGTKGVIHMVSAEYTGPLHFVQFWLDVIAEWRKETGKKVLIGLSATKDVQDAILADTQRAAQVELIDIRYWNYRSDGSLYAPAGGQHLAPRQHARLVNPGSRSFESIFRAVSEYRLKYPGKAVICTEGNSDQHPWSVFMAGGSLANLPEVSDPEFRKVAATMIPVRIPVKEDTCYALGNPEQGYIVLLRPATTIPSGMIVSNKKLRLVVIDPVSGKTEKTGKTWKAGQFIELKNDTEKDIVFWLKPE